MNEASSCVTLCGFTSNEAKHYAGSLAKRTKILPRPVTVSRQAVGFQGKSEYCFRLFGLVPKLYLGTRPPRNSVSRPWLGDAKQSFAEFPSQTGVSDGEILRLAAVKPLRLAPPAPMSLIGAHYR